MNASGNSGFSTGKRVRVRDFSGGSLRGFYFRMLITRAAFGLFCYFCALQSCKSGALNSKHEIILYSQLVSKYSAV